MGTTVKDALPFQVRGYERFCRWVDGLSVPLNVYSTQFCHHNIVQQSSSQPFLLQQELREAYAIGRGTGSKLLYRYGE